MEVTGDKMEKIFGSAFMEAARRNHLFYTTFADDSHRVSQFGPQEIAKAVAAYHQYLIKEDLYIG